MGMTTEPVMFFTDDITIHVEETSDGDLIGRDVSIREFTPGPVSLEKVLAPESTYLVRETESGRFMVGREVDA